MNEKIHRLTDKIGFSIDIDRTMAIMQCERADVEHFHIGTTLYYSGGQEGTMSVLIPLSKSVKKERRKMMRNKRKYEPTDELTYMVRATLLIVFKRWRKESNPLRHYKKRKNNGR